MGNTMSRGLIFFWVFLLLPCVAIRSICQDSESRIEALYNEAHSAEQAGNLNAAVEKYRAILRLDPDLPAAYNNLGRLYFGQSRFSEAIEVLKHALQIDATLESSHALLGISYYEMENYEAARRELSEAMRLDPADRTAELYLARSLNELGDLEKASGLLNKLQQKDPANPQILYSEGLVYMKLASYALAKLQAVAPDSYLVEMILATTAEAQRHYGEAVEHFKKAVAKAPEAHGLHYGLGHALYQNGEFEEALKEYRLELQHDPRSYMASWEAARVLLDNDPQEAVKLSSNALELNPKLAPAYLTRGIAFLHLKELHKSVEDLKKAAALDSEEPTVHFQLARAYRGLGMTQQAEQEAAIFAQMEKAEHTRKDAASPN
jgi:tetratricopeptide (TPR) repeat protein